ncbi:MAG: hypothetical protein K2P31_02115 [Rickettsiaceae bacterium]|nr:hypothetical protein [Rickettsiaceae bacterium]
MKKSFVVALMCMFIGLSASAALPKAPVSKDNRNYVTLSEQPVLFYECWSFTWQPSCTNYPMNSSICGSNLPTGIEKLRLIMEVIIEIEAMLCDQ